MRESNPRFRFVRAMRFRYANRARIDIWYPRQDSNLRRQIRNLT
jgi:hypothetical protein